MTTKIVNHHIIITDEEQYMIVNALAFFEQYFNKFSCIPTKDVAKEWQEVADDTDLNSVDALATKIANLN